MLEKLVASVLGGDLGRDLIARELEALVARGVVARDEARAALDRQLGEQARAAAEARTSLAPVVRAVGAALREALDLPSRTEVLALTRALEAARAQPGAGAAGAGEVAGAAPAGGRPEGPRGGQAEAGAP